MILDSLDMLLDLMLEFTFVGQRSKGVVVSLSQELDLPCLGKLPKAPHDIRLVAVELLKGRSSDREGHFEIASVLLDKIQKQLVHREIASLGYPVKDGPVGVIVVIMRILADIKKAVQPQPRGLVDLEI